MKIIQLLTYPLLIIIAIPVAIEFVASLNVFINHLSVYSWVLAGVAIQIVVRFVPFLCKNTRWLQTLAHESSHAVMSILMFHKIIDFRVQEEEGEISHRGRYGNFFIALAPYTLMILTLPFLLFRLIAQNSAIYIIDLCIGFTAAFHAYCFWDQTHQNQTDIKKIGYLKSGLYITIWHLFNVSLIILSIRKGLWGALGYLFTNYWNDLLQLVS